MSTRLTLTQGMFATIDDADFALVARYHWHLRAHEGGERYYVSRHIVTDQGKKSTQSMHTLLTGWELVDHVNGDGLDNRRANLRPATSSQNAANARRRKDNSSGFKGVSQRPNGRWMARIRMKSLGTFPTAELAARAYDSAATETWGEFARTNFPREDYAS